VSEGRLEAIWLKRARLGPMDRVEAAILVPGRGLAGNANQGGRRQVAILSREAVTPCERMDEALPGLEDALRRGWRGGAFGEVIEGGVVRVGDLAALVPATARGDAAP
jgi:hypothetical protein